MPSASPLASLRSLTSLSHPLDVFPIPVVCTLLQVPVYRCALAVLGPGAWWRLGGGMGGVEMRMGWQRRERSGEGAGGISSVATAFFVSDPSSLRLLSRSFSLALPLARSASCTFLFLALAHSLALTCRP
eukprot:1482103-Rhodomonas_salina.1